MVLHGLQKVMTRPLFWTRRRFFGLLSSLLGLSLFGRKALQAQDFEVAENPPPNHGLDERLKPILAGRKPKMERVTLTLPEIAEDGSVVPVGIAVDSPMTGNNHVKTVYLIVDKNPDPLIFTMKVFPALGAAEWQFKIRMAEATPVRALVEMNDGTLYGAQVEILVNKGGCE
jgi:sulfur-oxidizing protein SoxY